jgi:FKBP-type peptidyl-prolyl cis-trans isomerase
MYKILIIINFIKYNQMNQMKKIVILLLLVIGATSTFAKKPKKEVVPDAIKPVTLSETISYALGANIGDGFSKNIRQFGLDINWEFVKLGIGEAAMGNNQFSQEQMQAAFAKIDSLVAENQKLKAVEQKTFLEKNKIVDGIITTESGLQYKIVILGTGAKPTAEDKVKVHYHGTLIDGSVFDSSVERGEPITFPLNQVIKGWTEGVQLMPVGSKFIFYIPSELGYGSQGAGGAIPPDATLIFEVELLDINPAE